MEQYDHYIPLGTLYSLHIYVPCHTFLMSCGIKSKRYSGALGHIYYVNSLDGIVVRVCNTYI